MKLLSHFLAFLVLGWLAALPAVAQRPSIEDFTVSGDTYRTGGNCYQLTVERDWSSGSIWHRTPIDLSAPFSMELDLMLGCQDRAGADGMVFVFTPDRNREGYRGEGMGFAGLVPSLGIEIDTWQNDHLGDPPDDHIALLANGQVSHFYNIDGPNTLPNVEDCRQHRLTVTWEPARKFLQVALDGRSVLSVQYDIIGKVFRGQTGVYWGVTAATGQYNNRHDICFEKLEYLPALEGLEFDRLTAKRLLDGDILPLRKLSYASGKSELQQASFPELERLANLMKQHPDMAIEIFGHTDNTGNADTNRSLSQRRADAVADYLIRKGIPRERVYARGYGELYPIANNGTQEGRLQNRRVEIHLFVPVP